MSKDLPINAFAADILEAIKLNAITIVIGETGSGKTTQIPQVSIYNACTKLIKDYVLGKMHLPESRTDCFNLPISLPML